MGRLAWLNQAIHVKEPVLPLFAQNVGIKLSNFLKKTAMTPMTPLCLNATRIVKEACQAGIAIPN